MSKILIIEDEKLLGQLYRAALGKKYLVTLAYTGEEGLSRMAQDKPDLVIMDLNLPGTPGDHVAQGMRRSENFCSIPIIISTALGEEARPIADRVNAVALLSKPYHLNTLLEAVDQALADESASLVAA